jgi:NDP-sugar pyrophosphorylase family protein
MELTVIFPCAGQSTRFPNLRPKYLLTDYSGKLMIENAAKNFFGKHRIVITILKEHDLKFKALDRLKSVFGNDADIVILDEPTKGPAETIYKTLNQAQISGPFLIRDCDSFFDVDLIANNAIYVSSLSKNADVRNPAAKSYTMSNDQGIIYKVVEKEIVSDKFCVGGYQFSNSASFLSAFEKLHKDFKGELFVSNIIDYLIENKQVFLEKEVENYVDVGTSEDWFKFNNKPTYFIDIDGVLVKNSAEYHDSYEILQGNVQVLKNELQRGCRLIFCTARPEKYKDLTKRTLEDLGFEGCDLIMGIHHSSRILINDFAYSNPYPSAIAVNLPRDSDTLKDYLK